MYIKNNLMFIYNNSKLFTFQISMTVIPIHVRTEESVKILSMDTNVTVYMVIQEHSARLVSSMIDTSHKW